MEKAPFRSSANSKAKLQQLMADTLKISNRRRPRVLVPNDPSYTNIEHLVFGSYRAVPTTPNCNDGGGSADIDCHDSAAGDSPGEKLSDLNGRRCVESRLADDRGSPTSSAVARGSVAHRPCLSQQQHASPGFTRSSMSSVSSMATVSNSEIRRRVGVGVAAHQSSVNRHSMAGHSNPVAVGASRSSLRSSFSQIPRPVIRKSPDSSLDSPAAKTCQSSVNSSLDLSDLSGRIDTSRSSIDTPNTSATSRPSRLLPPGTFVNRITATTRSSTATQSSASQRTVRPRTTEVATTLRPRQTATATRIGSVRSTTAARIPPSSESLSKSSSASSIRTVARMPQSNPQPAVSSLQRSSSLRSSKQTTTTTTGARTAKTTDKTTTLPRPARNRGAPVRIPTGSRTPPSPEAKLPDPGDWRVEESDQPLSSGHPAGPEETAAGHSLNFSAAAEQLPSDSQSLSSIAVEQQAAGARDQQRDPSDQQPANQEESDGIMKEPEIRDASEGEQPLSASQCHNSPDKERESRGGSLESLSRTDSCELLSRLQTERRSIRGGFHPPEKTAESTTGSLSDLQWLEKDIELLLQKAVERSQAAAVPAAVPPPPPLPPPPPPPDPASPPAPALDGDESPVGVEETKQQQRSLSLPKSFLSSKYGLTGLRAALPSVLFPWRKQECATTAAAAKNGPVQQQIATSAAQQPEVKSPISGLPPSGAASGAPRRANATPASRTTRRMKSTSSPVFGERPNRSHSAWDLGRPWSHYGGEMTDLEMSGAADAMTASRTSSLKSVSETLENSAAPAPESALRKFRKSFSLRLSQQQQHQQQRGTSEESSSTTQLNSASESLAADASTGSPEPCGESGRQLSPKFRLGPLVWRSSKDRANKKGKKAARNAKCNSGDSGIQVENLDSTTPLVSVHLEGEQLMQRGVVRRTQSDLGGNAVIAAALAIHKQDTALDPSPEEDRVEDSLKQPLGFGRRLLRHSATSQLRRSVSQPMAIDSAENSTNSDEDAGLHLSEDEDPPANGPSLFTPTAPRLAVVLWDHQAVEPEELCLRAGDLIQILDSSDADWWWAARQNQYGWVPATFVQFCGKYPNAEPAEENVSKVPRDSQGSPSSQSVRSNVLTELITAERDYVKLLSDVVEGYLNESRKRADLFSEDQLVAIFGNLEELYRFQRRFLAELESSLNSYALEDSVVGACFLRHCQGFHVYSAYCNNQDRAAEELQRLYSDVRYVRFFEACRLIRRMIRLPLDAFLLSPVQKICKYPLQLSELLKHTPHGHPDRRLVELALDAMRSVAVLVNENKRKAELQQQLINWQKGIENWQGEDITADNSRLLRQGELYKVSMKGWTREVSVFLFDKQLVICKKELIKRNSLVFKDRVHLEDCQIVDVTDGKEMHFNVTVRHAFKLHCLRRNKWFLFCARTAQEKANWLNGLQQHSQQLLSSSAALQQQQHNHQSNKVTGRKSKARYKPALSLTLEEARLTIHGN